MTTDAYVLGGTTEELELFAKYVVLNLFCEDNTVSVPPCQLLVMFFVLPPIRLEKVASTWCPLD
jgi:hypothetical protein